MDSGTAAADDTTAMDIPRIRSDRREVFWPIVRIAIRKTARHDHVEPPTFSAHVDVAAGFEHQHRARATIQNTLRNESTGYARADDEVVRSFLFHGYGQ